jgi:hypothetical protein
MAEPYPPIEPYDHGMEPNGKPHAYSDRPPAALMAFVRDRFASTPR